MWYYVNDGQQAGPVDDAGLEKLIDQGLVTDDTFVWQDGQPEWLPLKQVRAAALAAMAAPAPVSAPGVQSTLSPVAAQPAGVQSREALAKALHAKLLSEQNLFMGILGASGAAVLGALLWLGVAYALHYEGGLVALAVGAGVGYANQYMGKGVTKVFGVIGAVLTLLGCLAGEFLTSGSLGDPDPILYLIYGIGIYEGYKFSFRKVTPEELKAAGL